MLDGQMKMKRNTFSTLSVLAEGDELPSDKSCLSEICARMQAVWQETLSNGMSVAKAVAFEAIYEA